MTSETSKIPANVRVMIAIVASPTLMVIGFVLFSLFAGNWQDLGFSGLIFSLLGILAYYMVFTGKVPSLVKRKFASSKE